MGGVAAALAAARRGCRTCLLEETDWLGGQLSAQGVSALDEHEHIETVGGTASYYALREALRDHYRRRRRRRRQPPRLQPGRLLGDPPRVRARGRRAGDARPARSRIVASGRLQIFRRSKTVAVETDDDRIRSLRRARPRQRPRRSASAPAMVIDATELGDLLPLAGAEYRVGAESIAETGEAHAQPHEAKAALRAELHLHLRRRATARGRAARHPRAGEKYRHYRAAQPYSLTIDVHGGEIYGEESGWLEYRLYDRMPGTKGGLWTYRRLLAAELFGGRAPHDLTLFNWPGNDYRDRSIIDRPAAEVAASLQDAKRVSLGFLHWLQTEAPATGERRGAPEIMLRPDAMGTADGLSKHPYIRESRRIVALKTIVEQEVSAQFQPGPRGGAVRRFGRHRLVPDRHPSLRRRRRRPQLPDQAVPDSARRADPGARRQPDRRPARTSARPISPTAATGCIRSNGTSARRPARWRRSRCSRASRRRRFAPSGSPRSSRACATKACRSPGRSRCDEHARRVRSHRAPSRPARRGVAALRRPPATASRWCCCTAGRRPGTNGGR